MGIMCHDVSCHTLIPGPTRNGESESSPGRETINWDSHLPVLSQS